MEYYLLGNETHQLIEEKKKKPELIHAVMTRAQSREIEKAPKTSLARETDGNNQGEADFTPANGTLKEEATERENFLPGEEEDRVTDLAYMTKNKFRQERENCQELVDFWKRASEEKSSLKIEEGLLYRMSVDHRGEERNLRTPETLLFEKCTDQKEEQSPVTDKVFELFNKLQRCQELPGEQMEKKGDKRKFLYDKNTVNRKFNPGDKVLVLATTKPNKLSVSWIGPGTIESQLSETNYIVNVPDRREKSQIYHVNLLKPYVQRTEIVNVMIEQNWENKTTEADLEIPYPITDPEEFDFNMVVKDSNLDSRCTPLQQEKLGSLLIKHRKVFSNTPGRTDLIEHLDKVRKRITEAKLTVKLAKCKFTQKPVKYLGHVVGEGRRKPSEIKIQAIVDFPALKSKTGIRRLLEMCEYYFRYIKGYALIVEPLTRALKGKTKREKVDWSPEMEKAFLELKSKLKRNAGNNPRLMRWALTLQPFNYEIRHRPGKEIPHVDCLSRVN